MTWSATQSKPVIFYPDVASAVTDWDFAAGSFGAVAGKWAALGGAPPTLISTGGITGYAVRFNGILTDSFIYNYHTTSNIAYLPTDWATNQLYLYFRAKGDSGSGSLYFTPNWYDSTPNLLATADYIYNVGSTIPTDGVYRLYRLAINPVANATRYGFSIGKRLTNDTFDASLDWFYYGHALDFQDLGPYTSGATVQHPFDYQREHYFTNRRAVSGKPFIRRRNAGFRTGKIGSTSFNLAGVTSWRTYIDYVANGTAFSIQYKLGDLTRDFIAKAKLDQDGDGIKPVSGMDTYTGEIAWSEVA